MQSTDKIPIRLRNVLRYCKKRNRDRNLPGLTDQRFIYFVQCREFVKVGIAEDVAKRMAQMQTGNPYELKLLKVIESADATVEEEEIHAMLERYRVRGEWFCLPEGVLSLILK